MPYYSVLCTVFTKGEQFQVPLTQTTARVRETTGTQNRFSLCVSLLGIHSALVALEHGILFVTRSQKWGVKSIKKKIHF